MVGNTKEPEYIHRRIECLAYVRKKHIMEDTLLKPKLQHVHSVVILLNLTSLKEVPEVTYAPNAKPPH